ncbi:MAG: hypothetical protein Q4E74_01190 [Ruminococcus sp.]|nr:hypothetical protein [Ruminococcus sp.]
MKKLAFAFICLSVVMLTAGCAKTGGSSDISSPVSETTGITVTESENSYNETSSVQTTEKPEDTSKEQVTGFSTIETAPPRETTSTFTNDMYYVTDPINNLSENAVRLAGEIEMGAFKGDYGTKAYYYKYLVNSEQELVRLNEICDNAFDEIGGNIDFDKCALFVISFNLSSGSDVYEMNDVIVDGSSVYMEYTLVNEGETCDMGYQWLYAVVPYEYLPLVVENDWYLPSQADFNEYYVTIAGGEIKPENLDVVGFSQLVRKYNAYGAKIDFNNVYYKKPYYYVQVGTVQNTGEEIEEDFKSLFNAERTWSNQIEISALQYRKYQQTKVEDFSLRFDISAECLREDRDPAADYFENAFGEEKWIGTDNYYSFNGSLYRESYSPERLQSALEKVINHPYKLQNFDYSFRYES